MLCAAAVFADDANVSWLTRPWQTEEGLPDNSVNGLAQTEEGYLWVGTPTGLARFDGIHFENIPLTNVVTMPNHGIVTMLRGRHGALWLAMDRGALVRLSGKTSRAFVAELTQGSVGTATKVATGALIGRAVAAAMKVGIGLAMAAIILFTALV